MIGHFTFFIWATAVSFSFLTNRDIFSPTKLYFFSSFLYFADIFVTPYDTPVVTAYIAYVVLGVTLAIQEGYLCLPFSAAFVTDRLSPRQLSASAATLWAISIVPLAAQAYLVILFGGVDGYINTVANRVIEHRGLGSITMLVGIYPVVNLVYFCMGLVGDRVPLRWWLAYGIHLGLLVLIGLASGSRGALLNNFAIMIMAYHYLRRPVRLVTAAGCAVGLVIAASVVGVARNGYRVGDYGFETGLLNAEQLLQTTQFKYGLLPLELVLERPPGDLEYGKTFLTVFTNPIPRGIWPGKPDPGGVVLTKRYAFDAWEGASNLSTGLVAESVLNFGWLVGVPLGYLLLWLAMTYVTARYSGVLTRKDREAPLPRVQFVAGYLLAMFTAAGLLCGEFTSSMVTLVLGRLVPLVVTCRLLQGAVGTSGMGVVSAATLVSPQQRTGRHGRVILASLKSRRQGLSHTAFRNGSSSIAPSSSSPAPP